MYVKKVEKKGDYVRKQVPGLPWKREKIMIYLGSLRFSYSSGGSSLEGSNRLYF